MHRSDLIIVLTLVILSCSLSSAFPAYYSSPKDAEARQLHQGQTSQPVHNAHDSGKGAKTNHRNKCDTAPGCNASANGSRVNGSAGAAHQAGMGAQREVPAQGAGGDKLYARAVGDDFEAKFVLEAQKRAHKQ